ncbi:protein NO VEIN domain-containing protein [Arthrobacter bambusae]|uniref:protein NO VEIN domain-containing protein n=1 Tax=Arthrobacter bambusae TaxID=1338426 RepID=UPI00277E173F|nr:DUF3883 domain-containing protein [Arthrobacter bambusae]MDQ0239285.1 hypothetical protein [Arthrobacter bambusae]
MTPAATAEELWRHNRGTWSLDESRLAQEKWVTLNHRGRVIQVIELGDPRFEEVTELETGRKKKALLGTVLSPGHPTYDVLMGTEVARHRNAIGYADDPELPETWVGDIAEDAPASSGQGRQMDSVVRKAIEDAAQERLMDLYRTDGWTVTDTRQNRPYDAVAVRGTESLYLEAKGTQSRGQSVIVTRNEVDHARSHPGSCIMGVWSGMRLIDGVVDPAAGTFRSFPFDPDQGTLWPLDYEWILPAQD